MMIINKWMLATAMTVGLMSISVPAKTDAATGIKIVPTTLPIEVLVDARKVQFPDTKPKMVNNSILIPLRFVSEKLRVKLSLSGKNITMTKGGKTVKLTIGAKQATVDGKVIALNAAAVASGGRTMVPLRFISEAFGESVEWDNYNQFVWIGSKEVQELKEFIKPKAINNEVKNLLKGSDFFLKDDYGKDRDSMFLLDDLDLPIKVNGDIIYRVSQAKDNLNRSYMKVQSSHVGNMAIPLLLLNKAKKAKLRNDITPIREKSGDVLRTNYYIVRSSADADAGDNNWEDFSVSDIMYVDFLTSYESLILLKPSWR